MIVAVKQIGDFRMKKLLVILALLCLSACVPPQGTPGYSLAGPSGNAAPAQRTIPPVESGSGTSE